MPEIWIGRIPVRTAEQASAYIDKVVRYESAPADGYSDRMLLGCNNTYNWSGLTRPAGYRDYDPVSVWATSLQEAYRNDIQPYWQATYLGELFTTFTTWDSRQFGDYGVTYGHWLDALNGGYHYVWLSGHGWPEAGAGVDRSMPDLLTNIDRPSLLCVTSCSSAAYDQAEPCLSEAFIRAPGGAVAYIGATRPSQFSDQQPNLFFDEILRNRRATVGEALARACARIGAGGRDPGMEWTLHGDPAIVLRGRESGRHIQVLSPKGCETIDAAGDLTVRWNAGGTGFGPQDQVKLEYSADSGASWLGMPEADVLPYDSRTFTWTMPGLAAGTHYRVRVTSLQDANVTAASVRDFTITPLYLLTVQSSRSGLVIAGSKPNTTPYTFTMVAGEIVTLTAPPASDDQLRPLERCRWKHIDTLHRPGIRCRSRPDRHRRVQIRHQAP